MFFSECKDSENILSIHSTTIFSPKKNKKGNDIETSELLWSATLTLSQITRNEGKKNVFNVQILSQKTVSFAFTLKSCIDYIDFSDSSSKAHR